MKKIFTSILVMAVMTVTISAQTVIFSEDFEDGIASTRWTVVEQGTSNTFNLAYDYSGDGIGDAPNGGGKGFKIIVNETEGVTSQVLAFPKDLTVSAEYTVTFDCWMNWTGTDGTTEFALFGIQHTDEAVPNYSGIDLAITGDGGSGSDVRLHAFGDLIGVDENDTAAVYINGTRNFTRPPYTDLGSYAGLQWLEVAIQVTEDSTFWSVNGDLWVRYPKLVDTVTNVVIDGNIVLGYADWFTSLAADGNNWIIYDNLVVTDNTVGVRSIENAVTTKLYPNPAQDQLTVVVESRSTLELINTVGQIVHSDVVEGNSTVDVSNLNPGMYIAKITSGNGSVEIHKILVK